MKPFVREVIVVEGKHDISAVRQAVDAYIITTGGSQLTPERLQHIQTLSARIGAIIFTDPDGPGDCIRARLDEALVQSKHAHLSRRAARSPKTGRLGIAHGSSRTILAALKAAKATFVDPERPYSLADLQSWQLADVPGARARRTHFCQILALEPLDAQNLLACLNTQAFSLEEIQEVLAQLERNLYD